jgi:quercetin dioxygenase-like cupin family protein
MRLHIWRDIPVERLKGGLLRQVIHTRNTTVARLSLSKGAFVPRHFHAAEQITTVESGSLRFVFEAGETVVSAGQSLEIPPDAPHEVHALEDSVALDIFSPAREDWRRGDDAYLRES